MTDPSDVQLEKTTAPAPVTPHGRSPVPLLIAALVVLLGAVAVWFFVYRGDERQAPAEPLESASVPTPLTTAPTPRAVCEATGGITLPALDQSDGIAGTLASALSANPRLSDWLATDDLIRRVVVVVTNVANGRSPAVHLGTLRPSGTFRAIERGGGLIVDPRSYERYRPIVDALNSVDVQAAARICSALKPRLDDAYAELGQEGSFDGVVERAIVSMLRTPAMSAEVHLAPHGAVYAFEDPAFENLTPAQKHLVRMGPSQMRAVQDKLRQIALAIGIPRERLPE